MFWQLFIDHYLNMNILSLVAIIVAMHIWQEKPTKLSFRPRTIDPTKRLQIRIRKKCRNWSPTPRPTVLPPSGMEKEEEMVSFIKFNLKVLFNPVCFIRNCTARKQYVHKADQLAIGTKIILSQHLKCSILALKMKKIYKFLH